ncbi:MAG: amino acid decarboxylase [Acidimicrobiia bacterium]|nr:amino acid decarboxylase [Acidimicrobiia bacterium]
MTPEEFRRFGHEVVDWIADFRASIRDYPVLARTRPGEVADALPPSGPEHGEPMDLILADFRRLIVPGMTHWNHPGFMAYFATSGSGPGILGELLTAALNVNGMVWKSSPSATELEQVTLDWLRQWMGLPAGLFGTIYDTASTATMHAIMAAREMAAPEERGRGNWEKLTLYCSEQAHSSVEKGAVAAGIGQERVRKIAVDEKFRMRADALEEAIRADKAAGLKPFCVVATVGTTGVAAIDPVPEIAGITERHGIWLHVDAAYGGSAAIVEEMRHVMAGSERADSMVVNPHKWLLTPVDCSVFYTRRPEIVRRAFSLVPEYLRTEEDPRAVNMMDYGVPLGRRFRALKLWFVMRSYGRVGLACIIRRHMEIAREFAGWVEQDERFEVMAPVLFSLVCMRYRGADEQNTKLLEEINQSGKAFLSPGQVQGKKVLRVAIGNYGTEKEDLVRLWQLAREAAGRL